MSTLVIVEHDNQNINPVTRNVLAAALQLQKKTVLLIVGHACKTVVQQATTLAGVDSVWHADHACYEYQLAENVSKLVANLASSFEFIIAPATTYGKNLLPRVAALLDVAQLSDVTRIKDHNTFEHPIYAGNALETVRLLDEKKVLTVRSTAFNPIIDVQTACDIKMIDNQFVQSKSIFVKHELSQSLRPDLNSAKIVVSGGRGLQNAENFKRIIEALADTLGAAVGASRAAVDAGFVPNVYQVGQTGKIVAPTLYIAVGISGAVQHLAGMKDSKVIVAINKDEDAPIFQIANYGLLGDLFEVVPQLIEELKRH